MIKLTLIFLCDEVFHAVHLAQLGLFDFARRIARDIIEDDLDRALIARQLVAELADFLLRTGKA